MYSCVDIETSGQDDGYSFSDSSDEDDHDACQARLSPCWKYYQQFLGELGFRLDTARNVRSWYRQACRGTNIDYRTLPGYIRACHVLDDDELLKDAGLPDRLFRGTRMDDGNNVVVKAVHARSREFQTIKSLSAPCLRSDPQNHSIRLAGLLDIGDGTAFIVMEEAFPGWPEGRSAHLRALRQCFEHLNFLHSHGIAHLDISRHNILFDSLGNCVWIDYESSRIFSKLNQPRIRHLRATELPPEYEMYGWCDPFKADIWALGMLCVRVCERVDSCPGSVVHLSRSLLSTDPVQRPTATEAFRKFSQLLEDERF